MGDSALVFAPRSPDQAAASTLTDTTRSAALLGKRRLSMATITTPKLAPHARRRWWRQVLLGCGIVAPAWWVAMDVIGSLRYPGYSYIDHTISELSAEGAPTRTFMLVLSLISYVVLMIAFRLGIWRAAGGRRAQPITAAVLIGEVVWGFVGGLAFPMATREVIAAGRTRSVYRRIRHSSRCAPRLVSGGATMRTSVADRPCSMWTTSPQ